MDDSCAVCAEPLEWVGYGSCCHREVCSTCVVRMRFILDDRRCCICKTESSVVFVTKALGDFTRVVTDFSVFPQGPVEGKSGHFWYHEDTQAFFDDAEHYKMIKAMCKLSCSVCDRNAEEQGTEGQKRRSKFRSIEQLKGHLFHQHKLFMCNLCLEGRKVFICEQKLYTRSQLNQHIKTGDSEVDGSESERGGFMGHPMCEFCRNPFYGENELYMHMSQEHYTCHICQRQHPGDYDYFRNYDDLEIHFRQEHFLCESEVCLAKKFVVFQTEAEMKRHNAIEHGGNMSRSKRNAALQIPTSFRYRRVEQEQRRGRGRGFRPEPSSNQLSLAIQASLETAMADGRVRDTSLSHAVTGHGETNQVDRILLDPLNANSGAQGISRYPGTENQNSQTSQVLEESSFPPLVDRDLPELSSRYAQALSQSTWSSSKLEDESFPPLPGASNKPKIVKGVETSTANNTLAARLHQRKKGPVTIISAAPRPHDIGSSTSQVRSNPSQGFPSATSANHWPAINPTRGNGFASPLPANSSWNLNYNNRMKHSSSAPNLAEEQHPNQATSSVVHEAGTSNHVDINSQPHPNVEDVHTANKFLIERIRTGLGMDEDKYVAFKTVSAEYRQGLINTSEYLSYIEQFGLSHLVLELAWLCPDAQKRKELIDVYNVNLRNRSVQENGDRNVGSSRERKLKKGKGKGKEHTENSSADGALTDSFLDTIRKLQLNNKPQSGEVEVLSKDGYRPTKDKNQPSVVVGLPNSSSTNVNSDRSANRELQPAGSVSSDQTSTATNSKQRKKTSKFHRARLGDGSVAALLDLHRADSSPERPEREGVDRPSEGIPVRGVWRKGGVQKLFQ